MKTLKYRKHEISLDNFSDVDGMNKYCVAIDDDVDVLQEDFSTESEAVEAARKMIDLIVDQEYQDESTLDLMLGCRRDGK